MKQSKSEQPPEPIVLTVSLIESGKFIRAGEPTPYLCVEDVPAHLREYIADGSEEFYHPSERNFYFGAPAGRGRARRILGNVQWQDASEDAALADQALPEETEAVLRDAAERHSALGKAQLQSSQDALDRLHESLSAVSEPQPLFVKRGAVFVSTEKASRFKPGEHVFARRPSGEHETIGIVDSEGQLPPEEILP